jgi:plastocyanin
MEEARLSRLLGLLGGMVLLGLIPLSGQGYGQTGTFTHTIFMAALEVKGGTSADKLVPPAINPKDLSKGYEFKAPGEADKRDPKRWEVSSYIFSPSFVTVRQGDRVDLTIFVVNGDAHESWITDPDGRKVLTNTTFNRGREYKVSFAAEKVGAYQLTCSEHAPTMAATFLVLPRK